MPQILHIHWGGERTQEKTQLGWSLLGETNQASLLGVSVSEALPQEPVEEEEVECCKAAQMYRKKKRKRAHKFG